jgi:hypothetical protein
MGEGSKKKGGGWINLLVCKKALFMPVHNHWFVTGRHSGKRSRILHQRCPQHSLAVQMEDPLLQKTWSREAVDGSRIGLLICKIIVERNHVVKQRHFSRGDFKKECHTSLFWVWSTALLWLDYNVIQWAGSKNCRMCLSGRIDI